MSYALVAHLDVIPRRWLQSKYADTGSMNLPTWRARSAPRYA